MTTVRDSASLHPKTVSEYQSHTKKRAPRKPNKNLRGRYIKVDPRVWRTALKLAKGDNSRIKVVSDTEVIVSNPRD